MHYSQLKFANVSKSEYIAVLSAFSSEVKIRPHWADEMLERFDKRQKLRGISQLVEHLANIRMGDPLPKHGQYKPFLRDLLLARMKEQWGLMKDKVSLSRDGVITGGMETFRFAKTLESDDYYSRIEHVATGEFCTIPEDYHVKVNMVSW